jgi:hypothetical protein
MRFSYLKSETIHYFSDGQTTYRRLGHGGWEVQASDHWRPYADCADLENAFTAWLKAQS